MGSRFFKGEINQRGLFCEPIYFHELFYVEFKITVLT